LLDGWCCWDGGVGWDGMRIGRSGEVLLGGWVGRGQIEQRCSRGLMVVRAVMVVCERCVEAAVFCSRGEETGVEAGSDEE
jgi:hypothetical protein